MYNVSQDLGRAIRRSSLMSNLLSPIGVIVLTGCDAGA